MKSKTNKTFEASLDELEKIVNLLEDGELSLEESLDLFEKGVKLTGECKKRLTQAERRIEILLKDADGEPGLEEIEADDLIAGNQPKIKKRVVFEEEDEDLF
ncbi:MAG: exodeoxyribonuclease VII small subunit [Pyrinomonadaceae bacterium]|nr:exodeoxyribonuclease VII small subunit [Pyrinomonadaceae bacterium]